MLTTVNIRIVVVHVCIFVLASLVLFVSFNPLLPREYAIPDAIIAGFVFSVMLGMLRLVIKYSHFYSLPFLQQIIIYTALGIIYLILRIGLEWGLLYLYLPSGSNWNVFVPFIPVRLLIALLAYISVVIIYNRKYTDEYLLKENDVINDAILEPADKFSDSDNNESEPVETTYLERISLKNGQKVEIIPVEKIIFLEAEGDYVKIHSTEGRFLKEQTMKSFENSLAPQQFVRIHRSYIVNVNFIAQIELYEKQNQLVKLKNGMMLKISRSGYATLRKVLDL